MQINHVVFNGHFSDNNEDDLWVPNLMCAMWAHTVCKSVEHNNIYDYGTASSNRDVW